MRVVKLWFPVVAWAAVILLASGDLFSSDNTSTFLQPPILNSIVRKLAHVVVYAILGLLTWRAARSWKVVLLIALAVAATDESHQAASTSRSGSPYDVILDLGGAGVGGWVGRRRGVK